MTQHEKILVLMRERKMTGINSFTARRELNIIQLPARIKELKELGHKISIRKNANRSVDYILIEVIPQKPQPIKAEESNSISEQQVLF
ncbi:MAG TPA: helix-turn-helix domain-containing protein [Methylomirabilota bacterium]|nr:helix-turn-helix domain-containing protein [Methylomirabilota bacterium]